MRVGLRNTAHSRRQRRQSGDQFSQAVLLLRRHPSLLMRVGDFRPDLTRYGEAAVGRDRPYDAGLPDKSAL